MSTGTPTSFAGLNQWLPQDRPKMAEFNADNLLIDRKLQELYTEIQTLKEKETPETYRNLLPVICPRSGSANGIDYTVNDDFSVTLNGTAEDDWDFSFCGASNTTTTYAKLTAGKVYTFSTGASCASERMLWQFSYRRIGGSANTVEIPAGEDHVVFAPAVDWELYHCRLTIRPGVALEDATLFPQITESRFSLPYKPWLQAYEDDHPESYRNLLPVTMAKSGTSHGVAWMLNEDNSVTLNGTATDRIDLNICGIWNTKTIYAKLQAGKTYTLSTGNQMPHISCFYYTVEGTTRNFTSNTENYIRTITPTKDCYVNNVRFEIAKDTIIDDQTYYPQITESAEPLPYKSWLL